MIKITITIEEVAENKAKENNTIKGKYIIAHSNFSDAYILGVPCKVMSEPFLKPYGPEEKCIKVVSCITGLPYTIPYHTDWFDVYDNFGDVFGASRNFLHHGYAVYPHPEAKRGIMGQVVNKQYYPIDNSYSKLLCTRGDRYVAGKEVKIVGEPYFDTTPYGKEIPFVNVQKDDGSIVKCMFMEWKLLP